MSNDTDTTGPARPAVSRAVSPAVSSPDGAPATASSGAVDGSLRRYAHLADLQADVGSEIAVGGWMTIDQQRIDLFAQATGDHQWIHVDRERAAAGPFGATVAHGFLTLSLLPLMTASAFSVDDVRMGVNYGLNRVRFPNPVRAGSRLRGRVKLLAYEPLEGGAQITVQVTMEIEGADKPACVAESVSRRFV